MTRHRPRLRPLILALGAGAGVMPGMAGALGLGGIEVKSALSQPFDAEIALLQDRPGEADLANIRLASAEAFARVGLERRFLLTALEFTVERRPGGAPFVRVRSSQPMREPYLEFLVEAVWPGGNLLRQYTVLLDPPARPWAAVVDPSVASAPPPVRASAGRAGPQEQARSAPPWPKVDQFAAVGAPSPGEEYGPVRPGDTLWVIAARAKPAGVGQAQAMAAILRANPEAFVGGDAARLMAGSTLVIPRAEALAAGDEASARAELAPYVPAWRASAVAAAVATPPAAQEPVSPAPAQGPVEAAQPGPAASPEPQVRLVQADGADGPDGEAGQPTDEVLLLEETLDAARQENAALRARLEALESQVAALAQAVGTAPTGGAGPDGAPGAAGPSNPGPTAAGIPGGVPERAAPAGQPAVPEESAGGRTWALAAVAAGLAGGLGFLMVRRRSRDQADAAVPDPAPRAASPAARAALRASAPADEVRAEQIEVTAVADDDLPGSDHNASRLDLLAALVAARNTTAAREVYADIVASGDAAARAQADALMRGQRA